MSEITRRGFVKGAAFAPLALTPLRSVAQQGGAPSEKFDFVVAGAGHNSLVCAAYLAKGGYKVLVLEGRPTIGGGTKTAEVCMRGFKEDLCSSVHSGISNNPLMRNNELPLRDYGYGEYIESDPVMHVPFLDGAYITVWRDIDRTCDTISRFSKKDAETFRRMVAEFKAYTAATTAARGASGDAAPKVPKAGVWQRRMAMSGYDLVSEIYESDYMRRANLCCGHFGSVPGGDQNTGNQAFALVTQQISGRVIPKGGSGTLSVALGKYIEAKNGVVLTNMPVTRLVIEESKCVGVECADGTTYRAEKGVISTIHVKNLVKMAPRELWGEEFLEALDLYQPEHAMLSLHYATTEAPKYPVVGGTISTCEAAICPPLDYYLRLNYIEARGEVNLSDLPGLQIVSPSVADPSRAPAGCHTVKIESNLPYNLKEGPKHWDNIKDEVADALLNHLRKHAPNLTPDKFLGKFIESPLDIERMNPSMWRGSAHAGAMIPAQVGNMRPVPGWANYRMPITGLYQTGACTNPGGSVTGMPGRNAAAAILKDNGTSLEEVVAKKPA